MTETVTPVTVAASRLLYSLRLFLLLSHFVSFTAMEDSFQFIIESPQHNQGHKKRPRLVTSCDNWQVGPFVQGVLVVSFFVPAVSRR